MNYIIKIGDMYGCKDCTKSCGYTEVTKENYPYCRKCKLLNLNQRSNK